MIQSHLLSALLGVVATIVTAALYEYMKIKKQNTDLKKRVLNFEVQDEKTRIKNEVESTDLRDLVNQSNESFGKSGE